MEIERTLGILLLVLLSAMGCSQKMPGSDARESSHVSTQVVIKGKEYQPSILTIPAGTTVQWINKGGEAHTVTSSDGLFTGDLGPMNGSFNFTFSQPGSYEYHCDVFDYHVMAGKVIVR